MTMMKLFESPRLTHSGRFTFQTKYHLERLLLPLPDVVTTHDSHCITFGEETTKACSAPEKTNGGGSRGERGSPSFCSTN